MSVPNFFEFVDLLNEYSEPDFALVSAVAKSAGLSHMEQRDIMHLLVGAKNWSQAQSLKKVLRAVIGQGQAPTPEPATQPQLNSPGGQPPVN